MKKLFTLIVFLLMVTVASAQPLGPGGIYGGSAGIAVDSIWTSAGDILYGTGDNTGTVLSHPGAANYFLYTSGASTIAWLLGTNITALAGLTPTDQAVIGWSGTTMTAFTTHSHSDSAAQFYDNSTPTALVKINPATVGTATISPIGAYELAYTLTGATAVTFPTSGTLAILGANTFTGNQTLDDGTGASPTLTFQDATNETAVFEKSDAGFLTLTTVAGDGLNIVTGNFKVGNGSPTQTQDGEDAYIEGMLEVDGVIYADGGITGATANDPYIKFEETDGTDWWVGLNDSAGTLEMRSSVTAGASLFMQFHEGGNEMLLSKTTVTFAADGDTTIYTVPTGKRCVLTKAVIVAAADAGSTDITIGANGTENDWLPTNQMDNLDAEYDAVIVMPVPNTTPTKIKSYAADTVIQINVANHAGAAGNTVYLFGILY